MWEIYSVGNPTFLIEVFRGIARLWSTNDVYLMISSALVLGLLWNTLNWAMNQEKAPFPAKGFVFSIIMILALLGPQSLTDVRVVSKRDSSFQIIDNVPLLPAIGGWLITSTGTTIADFMAQAFSIADIDSWQALSPIQHFVNLSDTNYSDTCIPNDADQGYNVCKTLNSYLNECFVASNLITPNASNGIDKLLSAKPRDIFPLMRVENVNLEGRSYLEANNPAGVVVDCPTLHSKLTVAMSETNFQQNMKNSLLAQGVDLNEVGNFLQQYGAQGVIPAAESSLQLANTAFLRSVFRDYFTNSPYGQQVSRAMFDTVRQRQLANATKKEFWMENAEVMQSFLEALTVFIVPFLALVLSVSGQGLFAVGQYFAAWAFVQLWSVMIVLVNMFTALAMTNRFTDAVSVGKSQFSLSSIDSQFATANSYIGISGMLYTMIPPICIFVLYRGIHAVQGMSRQAMADPSINSQRLSPDTGGTVSNGQISYGNQTSMFENNTGRYINGDSLATTTMGQYSIGNSMGGSSAAGASEMRSQAQTYAASAQKALDNIFGNSSAGQHDFVSSTSSDYRASSMSEYASAAANAVSQATGMSMKEAQQLVAGGAVSVGLEGGLSFGLFTGSSSKGGGKGGDENKSGFFGQLGASANADIKTSLGLNANGSQETNQNYQRALSKTEGKKDAINAALSKITTGSEGTSFSDIGTVQENAKLARSFTQQSQAAEQQQIMLTGMATQSGQVSSSKQLDVAGLSTDLKTQNLEQYLSSQNPELWERIKNTQVDGITGDKWLENKSADVMKSRESKSVNPIGEGRAGALMQFIDRLDSIDTQTNSSGNKSVDIEKEQRDAAMNRDIYNTLAGKGVVNADAGESLYQDKLNTLQDMARVSGALTQSQQELAQGSPVLPSSEQFNQEYVKSEGASQTKVSNAGSEAKNGLENVELAAKQDAERFNNDGNVLTGPIEQPLEAKQRELEARANDLAVTEASITSVLNAVQPILGKGADMVKPDGETAFNNFVETQVKNNADISSYRPEYAAAVGSISELDAFSTGSMQDRLASMDGDKARDAQEMINVLSNDQLMTTILGKDENGRYGEGTDESKRLFDQNTLAKLSEGANWLQDYNPGSTETKAVTQAIENSEQVEGDAVRTYLTAMQSLGVMQQASSGSDGKLFSYETINAAEDIESILSIQETGRGKYAMIMDLSDGTTMTSGTYWYPAGDREGSRDSITARLNTIEEMAQNMGALLNPEQKAYIDQIIENVRVRIKEDSGDKAGQELNDGTKKPHSIY
ncbi:conjugal transfer protein TraG N-terminal domain-containing protein [Shewanella algae]|uniref:conjugal transfer protein TraG N-terminal domain-containing protein n=1 Tax=Shewanella TaxID=22 RepID=UPI003703C879